MTLDADSICHAKETLGHEKYLQKSHIHRLALEVTRLREERDARVQELEGRYKNPYIKLLQVIGMYAGLCTDQFMTYQDYLDAVREVIDDTENNSLRDAKDRDSGNRD